MEMAVLALVLLKMGIFALGDQFGLLTHVC